MCPACKELTCPGFVPEPQMKAAICMHQPASDAANISLPSLILASRDLREDSFGAEAPGSSPFGSSLSEPGGHCQTESIIT